MFKTHSSRSKLLFAFIAMGTFLLGLAHITKAQHASHSAPAPLRETGQSAFTALQEIIAYLIADEKTDWRKVDIEKLRQHLIDMDNVTLRAKVKTQPFPGGAKFNVTSTDAGVAASIKRMVTTHVATMKGANGWMLSIAELPTGASMSVAGKSSADAERIQGLGFIGVMTLGAHHQRHHLALASGANPHAH